MASKRKAFLSRSVSLSLAALIVLTGAMFLITTLEQDHQEWKLVEDQVFDEVGVFSTHVQPSSDAAEYDFSFDEETATYTYVVTGGDKASSSRPNLYSFSLTDSFDSSKVYKFVIKSASVPMIDFSSSTAGQYDVFFNLKTIAAADDGSYSGEVVLLDQYVTDLTYKDFFYFNCQTVNASSVFAENVFSLQVYVLEDDNAGSIAAAITGLTLIVMGVFATPMLNVFRRR